jgi:hypothetical protein
MKKLSKKFKRPRLKKKQEAIPSTAMPRITNETVAEHREEVLSSARKYIYPLQHSKHKIVILTISIVIVAFVAFFTYSILALYRFQSTSTFLYKATQVIPFPIARQGGRFIAYENYLFEVRRNQHYYENQQKLDIKSESSKQQLTEFKRLALENVINETYIKRIAKEKNITVSDSEVDDQITLMSNQAKLGNSNEVLEDVLREYWGWSKTDLKRRLKSQLLEQKVLLELDKDTKGRADAALAEIKSGVDFADAAKRYSDDVATKDNGGEYAFVIEKSNRGISPQTIDAIFKLQPGQTSELVNTGTGLEIYKLLEMQEGGKAKVAHIVFNFKDINDFLNDSKEKIPTRTYIALPEPVANDAPAPNN